LVLVGNLQMKLSVALITYNQERFIAQAVESALAQKVNFDCEIVIGEDCSTDGTRAIVADFARRNPDRIRPILREQNVGGLRNIESTLDACRGQYVAILEGDDYWTCEKKLQRQVDFLDAHPDCAICCHRVLFLDESCAEKPDSRSGVHPRRPPGTYTLEDLLEDNFIATCSTVLRRELMVQLPPTFLALKLGDWPRNALAARHGNIQLMDENMATYRLHPTSVWSSLPLSRQFHEVIRMLELLGKELGNQYTRTIRSSVARFYLELAYLARSEGNRIETARHLSNCVRNGGLRLGISPRTFAGLAAYTLFGSRYKIFSRANSAPSGS
jgi:glycosyltransferase involved in cell wall biosynthesis